MRVSLTQFFKTYFFQADIKKMENKDVVSAPLHLREEVQKLLLMEKFVDLKFLLKNLMNALKKFQAGLKRLIFFCILLKPA